MHSCILWEETDQLNTHRRFNCPLQSELILSLLVINKRGRNYQVFNYLTAKQLGNHQRNGDKFWLRQRDSIDLFLDCLESRWFNRITI